MLLELEADADTILAALATHFLGLDSATHRLGDDTDYDDDDDENAFAATDRAEKLAVIRSQCGPIVHQIVRDGARLGSGKLFRPPPEATRFRRDASEYQALLDLDHHNAQLARWVGGCSGWVWWMGAVVGAGGVGGHRLGRVVCLAHIHTSNASNPTTQHKPMAMHTHNKQNREYLLAATQDARAFVVHMAGLVHALRNQHRLALHRRHLLALESLQLYVPVAHALGLGSRLREMEELSYRALFPDSYDRFFAWHRDFADLGQLALLRVGGCGVRAAAEDGWDCFGGEWVGRMEWDER